MSLLQMSFSGAVLIIVIAAIRAVTINRLPKKTFLILWGIVLFRLLIPYSMPSTFSVYTLVSPKAPVSGTAVNTENRENSMEGVSVQTPENEILPAIGAAPYEQTGGLSQEPVNSVPAFSITQIIWFTGMILCIIFFTSSYLYWRFAFQTSLPIQNHFVEQWRKTHLKTPPVLVRQSDRISTPLSYGIFQSVILMPKKTDWSNTEQLEYVFLHEYVHICRHDSAVKLISTLALCVHWFNPLVWVMYVLFQRDIELACDESVIRRFGELSKTTYATMLIDMEAKKSGLMPLCNNFCKNAIEERITAIMKMKKTSVIAVSLSVILVVGVTAAFATSASAKKAENNNADFIREEYDKRLALSELTMQEGTVSDTQVMEPEQETREYPNGTEEDYRSEWYKVGVVNTDALKIREQASGDASVSSLLPQLQRLTILSEEKGFYHIFVPGDDGLDGWVRKEYVDVDGWVKKSDVDID